MVLLCSIIPFSITVYADDTSGIDFSQAYIYDTLQEEMVKENPFVFQTNKDLVWIRDAIELGMIAGGVDLAGTGGFGSKSLTSSDALKLKDFYDKAKGIIDTLPDTNNDFLGNIRYYKGEPYYCDFEYCRFFRLTDSMKRELSEMEKKELIGQFYPSASDYQKLFLLARFNQNALNTLLYYTGETGQALEDLIAMYKANVSRQNEYGFDNDTATTVVTFVHHNRNVENLITEPRWFTFNGTNYPFVMARVNVEYDSRGRLSYGHAFYGRAVYNNKFWLIANSRSNTGYSYDWNISWMKPRKEVYYTDLENIVGTVYGISIGGYGVDNEPFTSLPFTFPGRSLSPGLYDAGTVSDDFVKPIKDFINDEFDDNMPGYADGADDEGHVPDYRDDTVPVSYNSVPTPTILPIDLPLVPPDDPGDDPDDPGDDPDDPGDDRPEYPSDNPVQPGEPMNVPSVSWNGMQLDIDDIYIPDFTNAFPFCIPFDIINGIRGFTSQEQAPIWTIPVKFSLNGQSIVDTSIVIDLTQWEMGLFWPILRGCLLIIFIIGLCIFTIKLIK